MQYTLFGNTGMSVSRCSLGGMTFPNRLELKEAARVVDEAVDNGVNLIDSAESYGDSEEVLGRILGDGKREKFYLVTKVFKPRYVDEHVGRNSRANILHSLERSLRLLRTDYVDLYLLHHPDPRTPIEETLATLDTLVKQGKVRYVGVSNHYAWQMAYMLGVSRCRELEPIVTIQASYSILDRRVETETLPFCRRFNVAMMCYNPLLRGVLTGKYHDAEGNVIESMITDTVTPKMRQSLDDEDVRRQIIELRKIAKELGLELNQMSILWLLSKPEATIILLGGSAPEHFTAIYPVVDRELPAEVVERIDELSAGRIYRAFRNQPQRDGYRLWGQS